MTQETSLFPRADQQPGPVDSASQYSNKLAQPLATRLRPSSLEDFFGNTELFTKDGVFAENPKNSLLSAQSLILWGPPGSGKTTLAHILAKNANLQSHYLSAVTATLLELRELIKSIKEGESHILFLDEIHRFNKIQQDALLPVLESGKLRLIGATTENPYFELRKALLSRCRVVRLEKLSHQHLRAILERALHHAKGYKGTPIEIAPDVLEAIALHAGGDARSALNLLELAVSKSSYSYEGKLKVGLSNLKSILTDQHLAYQKNSEQKRDLISAFIKSIRGSDPNASIYWLSAMVAAGEDPNYIMRRLIISASEDIGLADPSALTVVISCANALERIGMPEGKYALSQATLYLATANKSNSTSAIFKAEEEIKTNGAKEVPFHLRNASFKEASIHGIGSGYLNPHQHKNIPASYSYLPDNIKVDKFYVPGELGYEKVICQRIEHWQGKKGEQ